MKKGLILALSLFTYLYLLLSMYNLSINLAQWSGDTRFVLILLGGITSFLAFIISYLNSKK